MRASPHTGRPPPSAGAHYQLVALLSRLLPYRRYAAASRLMCRPGLRTAPLATPYGRWVVVPGTPSSWALAYGLKEPDVQQHLGACLDAADAFVDVGANMGWYALQASARPQIREIVAVEPVARSAQFIGLIAALNALDRLRIVNGCVTGHDGEAAFRFTPGAFAEHGRVASLAEPAGEAARVPSYTLERLLGQLDPARRRVCVKVDVEGHERVVLESASAATLGARVASLLVEAHLYLFDDPVGELRRLCALAAAVGEPRFLLPAPSLSPGYRRLWRTVTGRYPLRRMTVDALCALVERHRIPELFIVARREVA